MGTFQAIKLVVGVAAMCASLLCLIAALHSSGEKERSMLLWAIYLMLVSINLS